MQNNQTSKIYLYLARRDKKKVRILTTFQGHAIPPTRIDNIKKLGLPKNISSKLEATIFEDRMLWEPWMEAAESFDVLKTSLKNRGYKPPGKSKPQFPGNTFLESNVKGVDKTTLPANLMTNRIPIRKTMLGG